ncbi:MAG: ADP-ribosylglycohydrolase family protein [Chromatiaceae bacterium]|nr:ADP-ribosylglycohydrolase family protein [Chromatiaceae bacterium]
MQRSAPTPNPLTFDDRARGALLGLACGDRFGAPLEFVADASVRYREVPLGHWTDDTHMSLYLGEAVLAYGPATRFWPFDPERFGTCVGEAFVRWLHDPLTPTTAPGLTCLAGVRHFASHRDWHTSGIVASDGCGAVMRIVPLALAWQGRSSAPPGVPRRSRRRGARPCRGGQRSRIW